MTEADWDRCTYPQGMVEWLRQVGKATDRKCRLFGVASSRRVWGLLPDEWLRRVVEVAEQHAEGLADDDQLENACRTAFSATGNHQIIRMVRRLCGRGEHAYYAALTFQDAIQIAYAGAASEALRRGISHVSATIPQQERAAHASLVRDLFGNPFLPPPAPDRSLLTPDIMALARAAYEERKLPEGTLDQGRLAALADALEAAGCTDAGLLGHLRSAGPHVRGCFALDAVLAKG